jgi:hypothetical protein
MGGSYVKGINYFTLAAFLCWSANTGPDNCCTKTKESLTTISQHAKATTPVD